MATGDNDDTECNLFAPDHEEEEESEGNSGKNVDVNDVNSKTSLISPDTAAFEKLVAKIRDLVEDNHGEAIYTVGVGEINETPGLNEEDLKASIATLQGICDQLNCDCNTLREKSIEGGKTVEFLLREKIEEEDFSEVRVAVVGNVDAGKSTLLGVLTHGLLDDGRGTARLKLFRHKHEAETGRTSSVGNDILGFDSKGDVVNKPDPHSGSLDWTQICRESSKVLTFIDLAGHEKYLKTTVFGMTGHAPDFCMLMIGSNAGIVGMTKEHLGLALALNVPVFIVVTKIDMCPPNILQETLKLLTRILKSPGCRKIPVFVSNNDDVIVSATNFTSERICPIFQVSNVTGLNLDLLKSFLNLLSTRGNYERKKPAIFQIDDTYSVPGVGTVISGTTLQGVIRINDVMLLGPDGVGVFQSVPIKSVHRKRLPVKEVRAGQSASFAMKKIKRQDIRKGMVLVSPELEPTATWEFDADVLVLHHPTTISQKYQAMVHCGSLRQTATIVRMDKEHLRTGDKADCRFRFMKGPEYIQKGSKMIFREGRTKAVGTITNLYDNVVGKASHNTRVSKQHKAMMHSSAAARRGSGPRQPFSNTTAATASGATPTEKQTMSVM